MRLIDVYAIATGAMFSSGFFLLPGIASAETGPSIVLAYLVAGFLVLPAMLSAAELSTAMPRAGGPYYFLDRSLGPLWGTIGGLGTWAALVFKSAFALVGMGAYLGLFFDLAVRPLAVALTVAFLVLNLLGARKTSRLQIALVVVLVSVLAYVVVAGGLSLLTGGVGPGVREQFTPLFTGGTSGFLATVGLVFVSYAGLTQVASVAEEVEDPGRTIPLGMVLSLLTATTVYVLGVALMVAVSDPVAFADDLTPVATAAEELLPQPVGLILVVAAAFAAFASTGNAGMLAAARYPLGMARDRLLWHRFARISPKTGTPVTAIVVTGAVMAISIMVLDVDAIASLASAFMLLIFGLMNLAVIVMRESRIRAYDPRFRLPFYPWTPIAGIAISVVLIAQIGPLSVALTVGTVAGCAVYYVRYARHRVARDGAIYHVFERLGRRRDAGLDEELFGILAEQGLRHEDQFEQVIARATVLDLQRHASYEQVTGSAAEALVERVGGTAEDLARRFAEAVEVGVAPRTSTVVMPYALLSGAGSPELVIVRSRIRVRVPQPTAAGGRHRAAIAMVFLIGDEDQAGQALRILAQLTSHVSDPTFASRFEAADEEQELKETLLADDRMAVVHVTDGGALDGVALRDLDLPETCLVALIRREDQVLVPRGSTALRTDDRLTIIGEPTALREFRDRGWR